MCRLLLALSSLCSGLGHCATAIVRAMKAVFLRDPMESQSLILSAEADYAYCF